LCQQLSVVQLVNMRVYLAVWALCLIAVIMTCEPNNSTSFPQSNSQTQAQDGTTTIEANQKNYKTAYESSKSDTHSPNWYAPLERPEWDAVVVAIGALLLIGWQSWETRKAAQASQKNTELYISKERARLRVDIKPLTFPSQTDPAYNMVDFTVSIYGPTDAFVTESSCAAYFYSSHVIDTPDIADLSMFPIHSLPSAIKANSPPIECYAFLNIAVTGETNDNVIIAEIKAKHFAVGIRGWIKYRDVFGRDRETTFRHVWQYTDVKYGLGEFGDWIKRGKPEENRES
jgi:hypothetical protein